MTRQAESKLILDVFCAEPHMHLGVAAVMDKFHIPYLRALHEIGAALREATKDVDFSKHRDQIWP